MRSTFRSEKQPPSEVDQSKIQISEEARRFQAFVDEANLIRTELVSEVLAKIKAGLYTTNQTVEQAATKLIKSGVLEDL
ncbi:flagellar biosynthesis anti-sigma factor FlgM [bacterium]|nr:flagellar biosynthesis anti-sigma factor FlgM [bacterium]